MKIGKEFKLYEQKMGKILLKLSKDSITLTSKHPLLMHILQHTCITVIDIYKFILQGTCGWSHLITEKRDLHKIKKYLTSEFNQQAKPGDEEKLFDLLDQSTEIGRLNLRVWKHRVNEKTDEIWNMMDNVLQSAVFSLELFKIRFDEFGNFVNSKYIIIKEEDIEQYESWFKFITHLVSNARSCLNLPLVSHSEYFRSTYNPSYRLVFQKDIEKYL
ncbi:MAG: hypothetical protein KAS95_04455 [Candidatus Heimdallarchaeota archaeon]|nr:hypothetical protein [Candidatus Heimdallarchaeota archaeon]